ncbi:MAG: hypothetical protein DRP78_05260 [Candidatus Omnitrophota bacterium]|nr:MAG: hypothetical protein DRP78_05260 [Candidatus Omnitrophota bacterium]
MRKRNLSQIDLIKQAWSESFKLLNYQPQIIMPFVVLAIVELLGILLIFVALQPPFVVYIKPIVLRYWTENFLHYPLNLLLLAKLCFYLQIVLSLVLGTFITGMTLSCVWQYNLKEEFSFKSAFKTALFKYVNLLIITVLVYFLLYKFYHLDAFVLAKILARGSSFLKIGKEYWSMLFIIFGIIGTGFLNALFAFAQPAVIMDNKNFVTAIFFNLKHLVKNFFPACFLIIFPVCLYIPIALFKERFFSLMKSTAPEIIFVVLIADVIALLMINVMTTLFISKYYISIRDE